MALYAINYDLKQPGRDYSALHNAIKAFGTWCRPTDSFWIVQSASKAQQIRDTLWTHMDKNDALLVHRMAGEAAWIGTDQQVSDWLSRQLNAALV